MNKLAPAFELPMNVEQIAAMLPHRYPFLLLDRIIACEPGKQITAIKNVTVNEPFFQGHFPSHRVMPGVLLIESMAQAGGVLTMLSRSLDAADSLVFYLVRVDKARFNRPVVPGDQLRLEVDYKRSLRNMSQFQCRALVEDTVVAEAEIL
ncbi:3-hydroxyacyl-ACP dehydratase FabZ, partial [Dokdonella sp.]|uniref:3-hydroxyacyl-ACP dehydratase FabZ n=1 Tax=Dokdonella sp. TaxID=2291710 RepID=UPI0031C588C5|nr:3-hydroxyacyl-ACP dehydratase FabZ [Dokdonella sp.]